MAKVPTLSLKAVTPVVTFALMVIVGYVITRFGLSFNSAEAELVTSAISVVGAAVAGFVVKESPKFLEYAQEHLSPEVEAEAKLAVQVLADSPELASVKAEIKGLEMTAVNQAKAGNHLQAQEALTRRDFLVAATVPPRAAP